MIIQLSPKHWLDIETMIPIMDGVSGPTNIPTLYLGRGDVGDYEVYTGQARLSLLRFLEDTASKQFLAPSQETP